MAEKCKKCGATLRACLYCGTEVCTEDPHTKEACRDVLVAANKKLTEAVRAWKDAWFTQRDATGQVAWETPPDYPRGR